ncbi:cell elongation-specific peptidoglycan D,D-transpeptidase [Sediminihabitans luteus]|uniref:Cell elongation-specific peptidoglycan D,D-transpeptidase n=1 Tax=Sediminihabitans luteus TaxID=1138585 RepID=A0A2M9CCP7_9CELL|nr:penicillin-binding transpeptidase domain-containing protein [Sediminihabitans luteus]PJJ69167.1 cell elongation-specific peptidoglycan D,D-transpeptidase [Sediminihabitans luteus]GII98839.1 cell division protein FtsI [Sediminihabitans luteus]
MNVPIRRVAVLVLAMFLALMVATTYIQFVRADDLNADPRNKRSVYDEFGVDRGPIVVDGSPIASSSPVDDPYGFQREYANGPLWAPVTGFFSIPNGSTGLERTENEYLNGTADDLWQSRLTALFTGEQPQGSSVELTLDADVQQAAWDALGDQRGAVVAIEPKTGKILALVSKPSFDPNPLASHDLGAAGQAYQDAVSADDKRMFNRAIAGDTYPPGSTFKLVTSAAALESGDYEPDTEVPAPDQYQYANSTDTLKNFGNERCSPTGEMSLADALRISCNTAFAQLGVDLGDDTMREQAEKFGFDQDLSIPLTVTPSQFPPAADDFDSNDLARASIGQGEVKATPLQMAMVSAAIANDGVQMAPYLVQTVRTPDLKVVSEAKPEELRRSVSAETADELTQMMIGVVQDGSGTSAQIQGVEVAGKTGTAENVPGQAPHAWFTSFAPADDPQVAVAVIVEHGGSAGSEATGGAVAAPIAKAVMQAVLGR